LHLSFLNLENKDKYEKNKTTIIIVLKSQKMIELFKIITLIVAIIRKKRIKKCTLTNILIAWRNDKSTSRTTIDAS
jgi:hypothetical protein